MRFPKLTAAALCTLGLAGGLVRATAQDFRIQQVRLLPDGRLELEVPVISGAYQRLLQGSSVTTVTTPIELSFNGRVTTRQPLAEGPRFFRIERVSLAEPLDSDADGLPDPWELERAASLDGLNAADAAADPDGDGRSFLQEYQSQNAVAVAVAETSPVTGDSGVSVSRETVFRLSGALAADAVVNVSKLYAEFAGRRLLSRVELSSDRRTLSLYYLENLPAGARVRVTLVGDGLKGANGLDLDANGDGLPGGVGTLHFDTFSAVPVSQTAVVGHVFASEPEPGPQPGTFLNRPLVGVTVTVDGAEETLRATTDAQGFFRLSPAPAGRFFVHVDGRTAVGSQWPAGDYYPFVGKAWEAVAGVETNLAGGSGEIFLPFIRQGTLQDVSPTQDTAVKLPAEVVAENPDLAEVQLVVPANSLFDNNGARGGRVGMAPVPPDRLPEPLPAGLNLPLVITVQTDGPQNFDRPAPVRFPNLPDPVTGRLLGPGAKSALWSFDHDKGKWELVGPMTVTADGKYVETDPGVGIRQPGWHGSTPGTPPDGDPQPEPCGLSQSEQTDCGLSLITGIFDCATSFIPVVGTAECLAVNGLFGGVATARDCVTGSGSDCAASAIGNAAGIAASCAVRSIPGFGSAVACGNAALNIGLKCIPPCALGLSGSGVNGIARAAISPVPPAVARWQAVQGYLEATVALIEVTTGQSRWTDCVPPGSGDGREAADQATAVLQQLLGAATRTSPGGSSVTPAEQTAILALPRPVLLTESVILASIAYLNQTGLEYAAGRFTHAAAGRTDFMDRDQFVAVLDRLENALRAMQSQGISQFGLGAEMERFANYLRGGYARADAPLESRRIFFHLRDETTGLVTRGRLEPSGNLPLVAIRPDSIFRLSLYDPGLGLFGRISFLSAESGRPTRVPTALMLPTGAEDADADADGLSDQVEDVIGTHPNQKDSDQDGIADGAEVRQGTDPTDGLAVRTGVIASGDTPGEAVDVAAANGFAAVADSAAGVALFDVQNGFSPTLIAQLDTAGNAQAVALAGQRVAVADGSGGLVIVDVSERANPTVERVVPLGGVTRCVATAGATAYVGMDDGWIAVVDLLDGSVMERFRLPSLADVQDVLVFGNDLYALIPGRLYVLPLDEGALRVAGSAESPGSLGAGRRRMRLSAGPGVIYATHTSGYNVFDVSNRVSPVRVVTNETAQRGWKQIVPNGSGLGVATVSPNSTDDGPHDVSLYNLGADGRGTTFITTLETPGLATAVALYGGLAYVADGQAGLQVINYLPYDAAGVPPTISLAADFPLDPPQAEEGKLVRVAANVSDDAQVARVEFYVDGRLLGTDGNFPFEERFITPVRAADRTTFTLRAKAVDTGGNETWSTAYTVQLVDDATAPRILGSNLAPGAVVESLAEIVLRVSEPLDTSLPPGALVRVISAGPDLAFGTPDDAPVGFVWGATPEIPTRIAFTFAAALPNGRYQFDFVGVTDLAGNPLAAEFHREFYVAPGGSDGDADDDSLTNAEEGTAGTNPFVADTDNDGWNDELEVHDGKDPKDSSSKPAFVWLGAPTPEVFLAVAAEGQTVGPILAQPAVETNLAPPDDNEAPGPWITQPPAEIALEPAAETVASGPWLGRPAVDIALEPTAETGTPGPWLGQPAVEINAPLPEDPAGAGPWVATPDVWLTLPAAGESAPASPWWAQPPVLLRTSL